MLLALSWPVATVIAVTIAGALAVVADDDRESAREERLSRHA